MFSISRFCLARETGSSYAPNKLTNLNKVLYSKSSVEIWSFRPCLFSIKEALEKGISLDKTDHKSQKSVPVKLDNHGIPDDSPLLTLFSLLGPTNNPFENSSHSVSFLLAKGKRDLELFAEECWKQADMFGSSSKLVRGLRALARSKVPESVTGEFSRTKAAIKLLLPEEELKFRGSEALSTFMDNLCANITSGVKKQPEIDISLRYLIIRLLYGSGSGDSIPACFLKQFTQNTIPMRAYTKDITNIVEDGEDIVYVSKKELGKTSKYKTICLAKNDGGPVEVHSYRSGKKSYIIGRIIPSESEEMILSLSCGGTQSDDSETSNNILGLDSLKKYLTEHKIPFYTNSIIMDGSIRQGHKKKVLVPISQLENIACYKSWFSLESVNPKVVSRKRQEIIGFPRLIQNKAKVPEFVGVSLFCNGISIQDISTKQVDILANCLNTDTSFIKRSKIKTSHLFDKIKSAYVEIENYLPEILKKYYVPNKSLISLYNRSGTKQKTNDKATDVLASNGKRIICRNYASKENKAVLVRGNKPVIIGSLKDLIGEFCHTTWEHQWASIDRIFFLKDKETFLREVILLPSPTLSGISSIGTGSITITNNNVFLYSPLLEIFGKLFKRLLDKNLISLTQCDCGLTNSSKELGALGTSSSKVLISCSECEILKPLVFHLMHLFFISRTKRGIYLDWWDASPGLLDTDQMISGLFDPETSIVTDQSNLIELIIPTKALNNAEFS